MSKKNRGSIRIPEDPPAGPSFVAIIILFAIPEIITKVIGGYLLFKRIRNETTRKRYQMFRRAATVIGNRQDVSIRGLAAELGVPTANLVSDLQTMIDQGMMPPGAYIDRSHMMLHMGGDAVETEFVSPVINVYVSQEDRDRTVAEAKATREARRDEAAREKNEEPQETVKRRRAEPQRSDSGAEGFESKLREIRQLNDEIQDEAVSRRIDRIGELTASIFRVVQEKPEHAEEVRKFMNYYLPTTLKLLKSYSLMEKQSYQGENILSSRKKIESVLDTLIRAFEQQQDRLFRTEAMDVETDISVLETMMASDGLLEQQDGLRAGGRH